MRHLINIICCIMCFFLLTGFNAGIEAEDVKNSQVKPSEIVLEYKEPIVVQESNQDLYLQYHLLVVNSLEEAGYSFADNRAWASRMTQEAYNYVKLIKKLVKGFQTAAIKILYNKTKALSQETGIKEIVIAGGVAANSYLRELFQNDYELHVHIPDISLCTDNGAMVACAGFFQKQYHQYKGLDFDVYSKPKGGPKAYIGGTVT